MRTTILLFVAAILTLAVASAQDQPVSPSARIPLDKVIVSGKLPNGLTYYIRPNKKPEHRVELRLAVNAGSVLENDSQRGLAHLVEHMAFNGTKNFGKQEIVNYLESIGVRFGPDLNAYTSFDETVYMMQVPTDTPAIVDKAFDILEDWAHLVSFESTEIDKERGVVIEEWRLGRGAGARMRDKQLPVIFKDSRYADRLVIGLKDILERAPYDTLRQFYHDWYRPDLMAVVAVGDIDPKAIEALITKHFSSMKPASSPRPRTLYPVPSHKEPLYSIATDPEATNTSVAVLFKHDPAPEVTNQDYRQTLVENLYNDMLNTRLAELGRTADPPFLYAQSFNGRIVRTKETYQLAAVVRDNGGMRGLAALMTEALRVRQHGFTATELDRAKSDMLRSMESAYNEREKTESDQYASELIRNYLIAEPAPGITYEYALYRQFLPGITLDEVHATAARWITNEDRVIIYGGPQKPATPAPTEREFDRIIDSVDVLHTTPYVDAAAGQQLLSHPPAPGKVASRSEIPELGVKMLKLSNGITVVLKPTDFKNDEVLVSAMSPGGTSLAPDNMYFPAATAASVVQEGGLASFTLTTLQKMLAGKIAWVNPSIGELEEGLSGSASPKDLETLFQLIYLTFTAPRADSVAFASYITRVKGILQNRNARPEAAFEDTVQLTMSQYHPRRIPLNLASIDKLNLRQSFDFYRERFADASDFTFIFVGAFSPEKLEPLLVTYLGSLPALKRNEKWRDIGLHLPDHAITKEVHQGVEPKSQVRLIFSGPFAWTLENRNALSGLAAVLRIKLREAIREEKSGTYGISVNPGMTKFPKNEYRFTVSFGCAPERVEELVGEVMRQLDSVKTFGPNELTVGKVREIWRREREVNLKENNWWLSRIQSYLWNGDDLSETTRFEQIVDQITVPFVKGAAGKYLDTKHLVRVTLSPQGN